MGIITIHNKNNCYKSSPVAHRGICQHDYKYFYMWERERERKKKMDSWTHTFLKEGREKKRLLEYLRCSELATPQYKHEKCHVAKHKLCKMVFTSGMIACRN